MDEFDSNRSVMFRRYKIVLSVTVFSLLIMLQTPLAVNHLNSYASTPPYARVGAYALYSGDGGFVAFLSGVSANISYYVTSVYPNNTMVVFVNASISLGTEVSNGTTTRQENVTEPVYSPKILPAIPAQDLAASEITFESIQCKFVKNSMLTVPAGRFNATEYQGQGVNGTTYFWFDRATGLALEMVQSTSYFQLIDSNIATPLNVQAPIQSEIPFILIFITGWVGAGLLFYFLIRYYSRRAKRNMPNEKDGTALSEPRTKRTS